MMIDKIRDTSEYQNDGAEMEVAVTALAKHNLIKCDLTKHYPIDYEQVKWITRGRMEALKEPITLFKVDEDGIPTAVIPDSYLDKNDLHTDADTIGIAKRYGLPSLEQYHSEWIEKVDGDYDAYILQFRKYAPELEELSDNRLIHVINGIVWQYVDSRYGWSACYFYSEDGDLRENPIAKRMVAPRAQLDITGSVRQIVDDEIVEHQCRVVIRGTEQVLYGEANGQDKEITLNVVADLTPEDITELRKEIFYDENSAVFRVSEMIRRKSE